MTNQEAFNKIVAHLRHQNSKAMKNGLCVYKARNGKRCAVGCLIPDSEYSNDLEGYSVGDILKMPQCLWDTDINLLEEMQDIHDNVNIEEWETRFEKIAREFDLTFTPKEHNAKFD